VTDRDPALAQKLCNEVVQYSCKRNQRVKHEQASGTTAFLSKRIEDAKVKLDDQDAKLAGSKGATQEPFQMNNKQI